MTQNPDYTRLWLESRSEEFLKAKLYRYGTRLNGTRVQLEDRLLQLIRESRPEKIREVFGNQIPRHIAEPRRTAPPPLPRPRPVRQNSHPAIAITTSPQRNAVRIHQINNVPRRIQPATNRPRTYPFPTHFNPVPDPPADVMGAARDSPAVPPTPHPHITVRRPARRSFSSPSLTCRPQTHPSLPNSPLPDLECKVCMAARVAMVLLPCGHLCCCTSCCTQLMANRRIFEPAKCPICRGSITTVSKVFF